MPQMMPMSWIILYTLFMIIFMMFNMINYYNIITMKKNESITLKLKVLNWKW
uniref:ATP synthase F0 subunit 8 n=1 Tax=Balta curvirostris TaxID=3037034 RepID=UPI00257E154D|nr:ATP synthase F0 subunit 8 [Balta curvirostris]WGW15120.1 ATP synthase F0 subunit 8 [Balta curvirostris]